MASPTGKKIMKDIEKNRLKVSYRKFGLLKRALAKGKLDTRRYHGLNLTNVGNPKKNTIEFRTSNGTLNPEVIKKNVYLYASVLQTARTMALEPEKLQEQMQQFYRTDVTEQEKVQSFLNLVFESEEDRIVSDFLDYHFYRTGRFEEQMRMYCEFCDTYGGNQDIMSSLDHKIKDSKFKGYYTFYGTSGCSSRNYKEAELIRKYHKCD